MRKFNVAISKSVIQTHLENLTAISDQSVAAWCSLACPRTHQHVDKRGDQTTNPVIRVQPASPPAQHSTL